MSPLYSNQFHRVIDIHFNEMTCRDFEPKSLFETDPNECVHYNAMGVICGCPSNEPHPDACGPLVSTFFHVLHCLGGLASYSHLTTSIMLVVWRGREVPAS